MSALPLILSLSDELDDLSALHPMYYPSSYQFYPRRSYAPSNLTGLLKDLQRSRSQCESKDTVSTIGKHGFQVCMDVKQFKPSELTVKIVDNSVVVEGKHEEREDEHGYISRHFVRRYALPKDYDTDKLVSTLSSDGVLTVSIPKPPKLEDKPKEKIIQIQQVGPAHLNVKENPEEKSQQLELESKDTANGEK